METDFGILPAPKYNEAQESYSNLGGAPFCMVVPTTTSELERTGIIMEALSYESMGVLDTAFYDVLLKTKISRDDESQEMLETIFSTLTYYIPISQSYLNSPVTNDYMWKNKTDFASYFAEKKNVIQGEIDEAIKTYKKTSAKSKKRTRAINIRARFRFQSH